MGSPIRVTGPLLDVLEILVQAFGDQQDVHGWAIMRSAKRSGPTVYGVLDRLEDAGWISGWWEERNPEPGRPPRRLYRLTPTGRVAAQRLLEARRPVSGNQLRAIPGLALNWLRCVGYGGAR
jgi:DNA-binding PadR family transcriptional regulator